MTTDNKKIPPSNQRIDGSNSAGQSAEKCNCKEIICLCHVEMNSRDSDKKYYWKGGSGDLATPMLIVGNMSTEDQGIEKINKPFELEYKIINSDCRGQQGPFEECSQLYYFEENNAGGVLLSNQTSSGNNSGKNDREVKGSTLINELHLSGQSGTLSLSYNTDYLKKDRKLQPRTVSIVRDPPKKALTGEQEKDNYHYQIDQNIINTSQLFLKIEGNDSRVSYSFQNGTKREEGRLSSPSRLSATLFQSKKTNVPPLQAVLNRVIGITLFSQLKYMPASIFRVGVLECKDGDMHLLNQSSSSILINNHNHPALRDYREYERLHSYVAVLPAYEAKYYISISFKIPIKKQKFNPKALLKTLLNSFKVTITLNENYNQTRATDAEISLQNGYELLKTLFTSKKNHGIPFISTLLGTLSTLETELTTNPLNIDINGKRIFDEIVKIDDLEIGIRLSGNAKIINKQGKLQVKREQTELALSPMKGKFTLNLASILIQKIKHLAAIWAGIKTVTTIINFSDFAKLDITTDQNFEKSLDAEDLWERKLAFFHAKVVIYCFFGVNISGVFSRKYKDSGLNRIILEDYTEKRVSAQMELGAGACIEGRILVFKGALGADIDMAAGYTYGTKAVNRQWGEGSSIHYKEMVDYLYFNGLSVTYQVKAMAEVTIRNHDLAEGSKGTGVWDTTNLKNEVITKPYSDLASAQTYLQKLNDQVDYAYAYADKRRYPSGDIGITVFEKAWEVTCQEMPIAGINSYEDSQRELWNVKRHIKAYEVLDSALQNMKTLNGLLLSEDSPTRDIALRTRFEIMSRIDSTISRLNLPLAGGDYYMSSMQIEYDLRDEFNELIEGEITRIREKIADANSTPTMVGPDWFDKQSRRINALENEKEKLKELGDQNGRARLFDARIISDSGFTPSERHKLEDDYKIFYRALKRKQANL